MKNVSHGKEYDELPSTFKQWIVAMFNTIDTDGINFTISFPFKIVALLID